MHIHDAISNAPMGSPHPLKGYRSFQVPTIQNLINEVSREFVNDRIS